MILSLDLVSNMCSSGVWSFQTIDQTYRKHVLQFGCTTFILSLIWSQLYQTFFFVRRIFFPFFTIELDRFIEKSISFLCYKHSSLTAKIGNRTYVWAQSWVQKMQLYFINRIARNSTSPKNCNIHQGWVTIFVRWPHCVFICVTRVGFQSKRVILSENFALLGPDVARGPYFAPSWSSSNFHNVPTMLIPNKINTNPQSTNEACRTLMKLTLDVLKKEEMYCNYSKLTNIILYCTIQIKKREKCNCIL
jgi:hypothetical protein